MLAVTSTGNNRNNDIVLREFCQGYGVYPGQNSRSAPSLFLLTSLFSPILLVLALPHFSQKP